MEERSEIARSPTSLKVTACGEARDLKERTKRFSDEGQRQEWCALRVSSILRKNICRRDERKLRSTPCLPFLPSRENVYFPILERQIVLVHVKQP